MTVAAPDWQRIEDFVGFGPATAPYVFLGMEEGLLSEAALDADLAVRSTYGAFDDLYEAQGGLADTQKYFGKHPVTQKTWRPMCDLMLRLAEGVSHPTLAQRLRYMADKLGRKDGVTLLAELMPYPRKRADRKYWPYKKYPRFDDYGSYREYMLPRRLALLKSIFAMPCERRLVVAYGKADWPDFKALFATGWNRAGTFEWGRVEGTAVVLAHQFSTSAFNSDEDLDRFATVVNTSLRAKVRP